MAIIINKQNPINLWEKAQIEKTNIAWYYYYLLLIDNNNKLNYNWCLVQLQ